MIPGTARPKSIVAPDIIYTGVAHMIHRTLIIAALAGLVSGQLSAADLTVEVRGIQSADGQVFVAVHGSEAKDEFPSGAGVVAGLNEPAQVGTMRFVVRDLAPGQYAVAAFHDENGNDELDTNLLGVPSEAYGFSNDASATFGPPSFKAAAFTVGEEPAVAALTLNY